MSYGGSFRFVESKKMHVEMSAEQLWRFIIGIHFLDGFVGQA